MRFTIEEIKKLTEQCEKRSKNGEKPILNWDFIDESYNSYFEDLFDCGWTVAGAFVGFPVDQTTYCSVYYYPYRDYCISAKGSIAAMLLAEELIKKETKFLFEKKFLK